MEKMTIYTDGCCLQNPSGPGGYGVVILDGAEPVRKLSCGYRKTTNNRMELMAFFDALMECPPEREIDFYTDSKYAIGVLSGSMNPTKNLDLVDDIRELLRKRKCTFTWVKGHNGDKYNEECNKLATLAARSPFLFVDSGFEEELEPSTMDLEEYLRAIG